MNKHAFLLMIHNNYSQAVQLIQMLDHDFCDIYIHVDKKAAFDNKEKRLFKQAVKKSRIFFTDRVSVYWGDYSQIQAELVLFKLAAQKHYSYYHLLSGSDVPLMSIENIYNFFESSNRSEFVHYVSDQTQAKYQKRVCYKWICQKKIEDPKIALKTKNIKKMTYFFIQQLFISAQRVLKVDRRNNDYVYLGGSNWISITDDFMQYLLNKELLIRELFKHSRSGDELFVQTILKNSPFYTNRYAPNLIGSCEENQRYIDWKRGRPYVFRSSDLEELKSCGLMFARKADFTLTDTLLKEITK